MIIYPQYLRRLTQGMRCNEILGRGNRNIREGVPDDFLYTSLLTRRDHIKKALVFKYMFESFLFKGSSTITLNCPKRIKLSNPSHMMSIVDHV